MPRNGLLQLELLPCHSSDETALAALSPKLARWFRHTFGPPTSAQRVAWPAIAAQKYLLLSAPTGTGKTLAAFLPVIDTLTQMPVASSVRCLYLSPLKALATDVRRNLRRHIEGMRTFLPRSASLPRVAMRTGDTDGRTRARMWREPPDILLSTPESLAVLLTQPGAPDLFSG